MSIQPNQVENYLRTHGHPQAELVALVPLGAGVQEGLKGHGYGHPLHARFVEEGQTKDVVIRTMTPDPFGHNRRSDRLDGMSQAFDIFGLLPEHIRPLDLGVVTQSGELRSIAYGEPFLVTDYVEGELYAQDLSRLAKLRHAPAADLQRAAALADYLAKVHSEVVTDEERDRSIRDLVGHGEGIFGLLDAYDPNDPIATPERLRAFEHAAVDWRWRLKDLPGRARRTHGDFHPFNILFREDCDFSVIDASRGAAGDPADDVCALSINYIFFGLAENGRFDGALRHVWDVFWARYLEQSEDPEILRVVAPFFAWRALVVASPVWYPDLPGETRDRILSFAERLLRGDPFVPARVEALLG